MMWYLLIFLSVLLFVLYLILDTKKPHKFPPGPKWMPIIGGYYYFYKMYQELQFTHLVWAKMGKIYGPLVGIKLGKDRIVIANDNKTIREILTREEFDARPDGFFFRIRSFGQRFGIVFIEGEFFNQQKKFCMKHLKSFGLNRRTMEERLSLEALDLIAAIRNNRDGPLIIPDILRINLINSFWFMVAGERYKVGESRPMELINLMHCALRFQDMSGGILNQMPFLRFIAPELTSYNKVKLIVAALTKFVEGLIKEHRQTVSTYEYRDLIDAYITEIDKMEENFTEPQLLVLLMDLFFAGAETVQSTLAYGILILLHFPAIQKRLQEEMEEVVGDNLPEIQHRTSLKYFDAFFMELQRFTNVTPTTISHRASQNASVMGFTIPQDTIIIGNLYSLHMDKDHWGDPENFRPERFLDKNGDIIHDEWLIPFGLGKRRCLGETYAKTSFFIFLTSLLHSFTIKPFPGQPIPTLKGLDGATISPRPFTCMFEPRR